MAIRPKGTRHINVMPVASRRGRRKNYDTLADVKVGHIVIKNILVVDGHDMQASACLP